MSEHRATAALEVLVHAKRSQLLFERYVLIPVDIPDEAILNLDETSLPEGWDALVETPASTNIGDTWFDSRVSLALRVPSVVVPGEHNLLLNPAHADMRRVVIHEPEPFRFDPRLAS